MTQNAVSENVLARAYAARLRSDEYATELKALRSVIDEQIAALQDVFEQRDDVIALKRRIDRCEEERRQAIKQARAQGITRDGLYSLRVRTRRTRTIIPDRFFAKYGAEVFVACSNVMIGRAERKLPKGSFDDCCEIDIQEIEVSVERMSALDQMRTVIN